MPGPPPDARTRIWRIGPDGPEPLVELDLAIEVGVVAIDPIAGRVELGVQSSVGRWVVIGCAPDGACRAAVVAGPPQARNAVRAERAVDLAPGQVWPAGVDVELQSCTLQWPPVLDVRGVLHGVAPGGVDGPPALLVVQVVRPDGALAQAPLDVGFRHDGAFSIAVQDIPLGDVYQPPALRELLAGSRCQLAVATSETPGEGWMPAGEPVDLH